VIWNISKLEADQGGVDNGGGKGCAKPLFESKWNRVLETEMDLEIK
jgi:hypothetical protein